MWLFRFLPIVAIFGATGSLALMGARTYFALSLNEPLLSQTRGAEFETLFSIWSYMANREVYTFQNDIPFNGSYYNWLFYTTYGEVSRFVLWGFSLSEAWLPTITRIFTLAGCFVGNALTYLLLRDLLELDTRWEKIIAACFAVIVFFGPLMGFFGISATPDIWALVITIAAIYYFSKFYNNDFKTIIIICFFSYISWAFKQNFIYIPSIICLYLLFIRRWRHFLTVSLFMTVFCVSTLLIGGEKYQKIMFFAGTHVPFLQAYFIKNLINFSVKFVPAIAALGVLGMLVGMLSRFRKPFVESIKRDTLTSLAFIGLAVTALEAVVTGGFYGAAENHYFTFSFFAALCAMILISQMSSQLAGMPVPVMLIGLGWLWHFAAIISVLIGVNGKLSVRESHDNLMEMKACLKDIVQPVYVENPYLALPWVVPAEQPFVTPFNYHTDRAAGVEKEGGGIGGLIDRGFFATLALNEGRKGRFDGSDLKRYRSRAQTCPGLLIYDRVNGPASKGTP